MVAVNANERLRALLRPGKDSDGEIVLARQIAFQKPWLPLPEREVRFAPPRRWRFDFAWPEQRFAVEVEGGVFRHGGGAHQRPGRFLGDMEKYNAAAATGWVVWRFSTEQVESMQAYEAIRGYFTGTVTLGRAL